MNTQSDEEQTCPMSLLGWLQCVHALFPLLIFSPADLNVQLKILVVLQNIFLPLAQSAVHVHHITCNCQVVLDMF